MAAFCNLPFLLLGLRKGCLERIALVLNAICRLNLVQGFYRYPYQYKFIGSCVLGRSYDAAVCGVQVSNTFESPRPDYWSAISLSYASGPVGCAITKNTPMSAGSFSKPFWDLALSFSVEKLKGDRKTALIFSFVFIPQEKILVNLGITDTFPRPEKSYWRCFC